VVLAQQIEHDSALAAELNARAAKTGVVANLETAVTRYLAAEKEYGRIEPDVDEEAFGFLIAGAIHNLLVSGNLYLKPNPECLRRMFTAVAARLVTDPDLRCPRPLIQARPHHHDRPRPPW